jgi:hypothetical protein
MTGEGAMALGSRVAVQEISSAKRCAPTCNRTREQCDAVWTFRGVVSGFGKSRNFLGMSRDGTSTGAYASSRLLSAGL